MVAAHDGPSPPAPASSSVRDPQSPRTPATTPPIEPDPEADVGIVGGGDDDDDNRDNNEEDSAFGDAASLNSTESLTASIFEYRRLHGRTYQANRDYWAPNDDQQNEGLDILHHAFSMLQDDNLFSAPIGPDPGRIVDIGTGTGIWAIDVADQFPAAEIIGTDITPSQPTWVPPNLKFVIDDCLLDWMWPADHFDFVHLRALYGSVTDWGALYRKAFHHLKPGGWMQDLETDVKLQSDHVAMSQDHIFNKWADLFYEAGEKMGRTFAIGCDHKMKDLMEEAGFVDVVERKYKMPCHGWPRDPKLRQIGDLVQMTLEQSLDGLAIYVLTQILGWSQEEMIVLLAKMRREVRTKSNCAWIWATVVYGRKPLDAT